MKIITKKIVIENEEFILIKDEVSDFSNPYYGQSYIGTIPYSQIDENGKLKKALNGLELCICFESIAKEMGLNVIENAIYERKKDILLKNFKKDNPNADLADYINFYKTLDKTVIFNM